MRQPPANSARTNQPPSALQSKRRRTFERDEANGTPRQNFLPAGISQLKLALFPLEPSLFCVQYSHFTFAKLIVTFSVRRSSPPLPPVETALTRTFSKSYSRYSRGFSPALRTMSWALAMCLPDAQAYSSSALDLSIHLVIEMSWKLALPDPAPSPICALPELLRPQLHASTSIASLCVPSCDSPLMGSSFKNISTAMTILLHLVLRS